VLKAEKIARKIKIRDIAEDFDGFKCLQFSTYEVVYKLSENQHVIVYSFGVVVFIDIDWEDSRGFIDLVKDKIIHIPDKETDDKYEVVIKEGSKIRVKDNSVILPKYSINHLRMLALILAESVAMDYYEQKTEKMLAQSISYSRILQNEGKYPSKSKELLKFIGFALTTRQEILSDLYISDMPDETWNNPEIEKLFIEARDMFDIESRYRSINMSLNAIQESLEIVVDLLQTRRGHTLEWLIIILIFIEIVYTVVHTAF
jgi:uncharacterized Rmd1/YagE family protein